MKRSNKSASHVKFLKQLHLQLYQLHEHDMESLSAEEEENRSSIRTTRTTHTAEQVEECRPGNITTDRKRRQRACKVCSLLKGKKRRGYETTWFCSARWMKDQRVFLCQTARREYDGQRMTYFEIWHKKWHNGTALPQKLGPRKIRARPPPAGEGLMSNTSAEGRISSLHILCI